jgi:phosphoribosylanthranilate isomerase
VSRLPLVKICGVCREKDVDLAVSLGVDFVGFNFARESPRYVTKLQALRLRRRVSGKTRLVAVFIDYEPDWARWVFGELGADFLQVHGPSGVRAVAEWGPRAVRVFLGPPTPEELLRLGSPGFVVVDRPPLPREIPGGNGQVWAYPRFEGIRLRVPWLVAGGVRPENVRQVLAQSGADGVDVASGVELQPGVKDPQRLRQLLEEVQNYARTSAV